jgi:TupA-like ATPgrasp
VSWAAFGAPTVLKAAALLVDLTEDPTSSALRRQLGGPVRPSFHREVMQVRSLYSAAKDVPGAASTPLRRLPRKLDNYAYAASHGVGVPHVYGVWKRLEDVPWAALPPSFVLKSDRGANGRAVLPLWRDGDGYRTLDGTHYTAEQLARRWQDLRTARACSGPYFAEELLVAPGGSPVPDDVKVFAFYGQVSHVMLRRVAPGVAPGEFSRRYLAPGGHQLADDQVLSAQDPTLAVPRRLDEMVAAAETLSRHAPFPFLRVDMYDLGDRTVLGELTLAPGGRVAYAPGYDEHLGTMWLHAQTRLMADLAAGRPYAMVPGPHPVAPRP